MRVYNSAINPKTGRPPRIILQLPPESVGADEPDEFELDMVNPLVENTIVVAETLKEPEKPGSRARTTVMTGNVKHEANARPRMTEKYRAKMKRRSTAANTPQRSIVVMQEGDYGKGDINRLSSGVANARGFSDLVARALLLFARMLVDICFIETKAEACKGRVRAYGTYAEEPTPRCSLCSLPRTRALAHPSASRAYTAA